MGYKGEDNIHVQCTCSYTAFAYSWEGVGSYKSVGLGWSKGR